MALVALKCPNCGGNIQFDMERNMGFCMYCGSKLARDDVVTAIMSVDNTTEIRSCLELAKKAFVEANDKKFEEYVERAITLNTDIPDGWFMKAAVCKMADEDDEQFNLIRAKNCKAASLGIFTEQEYSDYEPCFLSVNVLNSKKYIGGVISVTFSVDGVKVAECYPSTSFTARCTPGHHKIHMFVSIARGFAEENTVELDLKGGRVNRYETEYRQKGLTHALPYLKSI